MLKADRICIRIFIIGFAMLLPSTLAVKFIDELCSFMILGVALTDCVLNGRWSRYRLLWTIMGIITAYALYSLLFLSYNRPIAIAVDWIIQLKPFIPFAVFYAIAPELTAREKRTLSIIAGINAVILSVLMVCGHEVIKATIDHVTYAGSACLMCGLVMVWCSLDEAGRPSRAALIFAAVILTIGLGCTRAKYYGIYLISMFFLYIYKPGMLRDMRAGHMCMIAVLLIGVLAVSWHKIDFYFMSGGGEKFDPTVVESFARPVLYVTGGLILIDHFPFGSGLASFATFASEKPYSSIYYEYGINNVWGLSPHQPFFICDAFYPSLAQFGVTGIVLFGCFWVFIYRHLRRFIRINPEEGCSRFGIGVILVCYIFIESVGSTMFVQSHGMIALIILGMLCGRARGLEEAPPTVITEKSTQYETIEQ